jgi:cell cycle arrest protein BUB3
LGQGTVQHFHFHFSSFYIFIYQFQFQFQTVRLYDATANVLKGEFLHGGPVLDCCFHDDSSGFSASADNTVRRSVHQPFFSPDPFSVSSISTHFLSLLYSLVFATGKEDILGKHDAPVRCVEYSYAAGCFLTSSFCYANFIYFKQLTNLQIP